MRSWCGERPFWTDRSGPRLRRGVRVRKPGLSGEQWRHAGLRLQSSAHQKASGQRNSKVTTNLGTLPLLGATNECSPPTEVTPGERMFVLDLILENCVSRLGRETAPGIGIYRTHRSTGIFREMLNHPSQTKKIIIIIRAKIKAFRGLCL